MMNLPAIRVDTCEAVKSQNDPPAKRKSEIIMEILLPNLSAIGPTISEPMAPPIAVIEMISFEFHNQIG